MSDQNKPLVNRVAQSGIITINLEDYFPQDPVVEFDLKNFLFKELILKEKDFRAELKEYDWEQYQGIHLCIFCSTDAIIPMWAYMLVTAYAEPYAQSIFQGTKEEFYKLAYQEALAEIDGARYEQERVVVKGCGDKPVPPSAYVELTRKLRPYAQSIMFGEPCSTVPIFKRPRVLKKK